MAWYYTVPEFLIILQMIILIQSIDFRKMSFVKKLMPKEIINNESKLDKTLRQRNILIILLCFCLIAAIQVPKVRRIKGGAIWYGNTVDAERLAIGKWIKQNCKPGDKLFAGHGHIAREAGIYTIDYTGLNSKITTQYKRDFNLLITKLKPDWIVVSGLLSSSLQEKEGYILRKSFYNISGKWDTQSWRIYKKNDDNIAPIPIITKLDRSHLTNAKSLNLFQGYFTIKGSCIVLDKFEDDPSFDKIIAGLVKRSFPILINVTILGKKQQILSEQNTILEQIERNDNVNGFTKEMEIFIKPEWKIRQIIINSYNKNSKEPVDIEIIDPIIQRD